MHEIFEHKCFPVQVLTLVLDEVVDIHILNTEVAFDLSHPCLQEVEVFSFELKDRCVEILVNLCLCCIWPAIEFAASGNSSCLWCGFLHLHNAICFIGVVDFIFRLNLAHRG